MAENRPSEWTLDASDARIAVRAWYPDRGSRGVVCLIHGLGEHTGRYAHVARAWTDAGYAVLAPDLRGHGRSSGKRGHATSLAQFATDIGAVVQDATGRLPGGPRVFYGHSMGGAVALAYALGHPGAMVACVATGPAIRPAFAPAAWKVAFGRALRRIAPSATLPNGLDANGLSHDASVVRAYRADPLVHNRVSAALGLDLLDAGDALLVQASSLRVPTLVVHGAVDPITSPAASREFAGRAGPACGYHEVAGAFHEVHNEASWLETWAVICAWVGDAVAPEILPGDLSHITTLREGEGWN